MRPQTIGRTLGIGLRIASRIAGQRMAASAQSAASTAPPQPIANPAVQRRKAGRAAGQTSRGVARGVGGFLRPFKRVGGIVWLEVSGVFFLLPVFVFTPYLWRYRASYAQGPDHRTFVVSAVIVVIFLYLGVSSFWRAQRK
jgi:hypothetical protein